MPWPLDKEKNHEGVLSAKNENEKDDNDVNLSNNSNKPTIIIYQDSAAQNNNDNNKRTIKAKDKKTGQILHSGTDVAQVIQRAFDIFSAAAEGGVISISEGY
jgi:hypothetical protein